MKDKKKRRKPESSNEGAVRSLNGSGKPIQDAASKLGVDVSNLKTLQRQNTEVPTLKNSELESLSAEQLLRLLKRVQKENKFLKRQREILKKLALISVSGEQN